MTIRAPFNFVPVSDKVFFPDWADQISHDIPFSDGLSGTIELEITAESPIFVRNGHTEKEREENSDAYKSFSNVDGNYFIPGTSLKGAIRNVMEIMSFGKMKLDERAKFAQREWDNPDLYPMKKEQGKLFCGWFKREGENYKIIDCGKPYRIGHSRIDEWAGKDILRDNFSKDSKLNINKEEKINGKIYDPKTAAYKYELLKDVELNNLNFSIDNEFSHQYNDKRVLVNPHGTISGKIVLTGQPDKWMWPRPKTLTKGAGKFYEFVFPKEERKTHKLSKDNYDHFKFIYSDSTEWERINREIESEQGTPIFFRIENNKIKDFGIAYLYKLPYEKSPFDTLSTAHKDKNELDLAECIFGTENKDQTLKGRVQFGNALCIKGKEEDDMIFTMGSPKASYYPIYIMQQNGSRGYVSEYNTYNDSKISGWKRYPIRDAIHGHKATDDFNEKLDTWMIPLREGAVFKSKVRFHNLKPTELAALYSALTFHKTEGACHQIGQGKPYGLGRVSIKATHNLDVDMDLLLAEYEEAVEQSLNLTWHTTPQITELITVAKIPIILEEQHLFNYMIMDIDKGKNEFVEAKKKKQYLQNYSTLIKKNIEVKSFLEDKKEEIERLRIEAAEEEARKIAEILAQEKAKEEAKREEKKEAKITAGLSFLEEKYDLGPNMGNYKVQNFKSMRDRVENWMKISNIELLPHEEYDIFYITLKRIYESANKREKKNWSEFKKGVWHHVIGWVGESDAKNWYDELIK